jgi:hypothetical protein
MHASSRPHHSSHCLKIRNQTSLLTFIDAKQKTETLMRRSHLILAAALSLASAAIPASAAPLVTGAAEPEAASSTGIVKIHGVHRDCEAGRYGWHRHNRYGERIACGRPGVGIYLGPRWGRRDWDRDHRDRGDRDRGDRGRGGDGRRG